MQNHRRNDTVAHSLRCIVIGLHYHIAVRQYIAVFMGVVQIINSHCRGGSVCPPVRRFVQIMRNDTAVSSPWWKIKILLKLQMDARFILPFRCNRNTPFRLFRQNIQALSYTKADLNKHYSMLTFYIFRQNSRSFLRA